MRVGEGLRVKNIYLDLEELRVSRLEESLREILSPSLLEGEKSQRVRLCQDQNINCDSYTGWND